MAEPTAHAEPLDFATRYDLLKSVVARYDSYYNLAAVKASLLLTSNAIFLAPSLGEKSPWLKFAGNAAAIRGLVSASMLLSLLSMIAAALVIASWLSRSRAMVDHHSIVFSESVARQSPDEYAGSVSATTQTALIDDMARLAQLMASNLASKFRYINLSLAGLVAAVVCACIALLL
ncbi:hypothetical protein FCE95_07855 [Luteimonas gilva]|uniref:Pycsar effector protein domain-containing protein n=1 Tax=Luteimonas gilva TaxID=2572684 RepID=A0A4U5JYA4_9GAMM|nr:hypothetical protein [Luteimonas gilva]TKR34166.1 hypothetical protein FCE95_07855 [Luteimonas gilva]